MLKHILVAVDGSDHAHKALEQALILAENMKQPCKSVDRACESGYLYQ
ncbi:universal stress protein [Paenibacillus amylolyticus]|nr:universal stress protein [Paenibacillus amylolyticus]